MNRAFASCLRRSLWSVMLFCGIFATLAHAVTYSDNGDGTVTDPTSGLIWMRCAVGQTWNGSSCAGIADTYTHDKAMALEGKLTFAAAADWRVPSVRELLSTVDHAGEYGATVNAAVFPNSQSSHFWSSTLRIGNSGLAWFVDFNGGSTSTALRTKAYNVRLVRGGQPSGLTSLARPTADYVANADGTATHTPTGLMWKRCAEGQVWADNACTGAAATYAWEAAKPLSGDTAGKTDWRLPTIEELLTLVDYSQYAAINETAFPNSENLYLWSSSYLASYADYAWYVGLSALGESGTTNRVNKYGVRLVRVAKAEDTPTLTVAKSGAGNVKSTLAYIDCGATCAAKFSRGAKAILVASPGVGASWGGACAGVGPICVLTMDTSKNVTVQFDAEESSSLEPGWNLLGNSLKNPIAVAALYGDAVNVNTVWKWSAANAKWSFYTPSMNAAALLSYANDKGYAVLSQIDPGEGYWVNVRLKHAPPAQSGIPIVLGAAQLIPGWNLVATGESLTPAAFNQSLTDLLGSPPTPGTIPINLTTLWAWDGVSSRWYFYSPKLEADGALAAYIASKGYLDFSQRNKKLGIGMGFWVNRP